MSPSLMYRCHMGPWLRDPPPANSASGMLAPGAPTSTEILQLTRSPFSARNTLDSYISSEKELRIFGSQNTYSKHRRADPNRATLHRIIDYLSIHSRRQKDLDIQEHSRRESIPSSKRLASCALHHSSPALRPHRYSYNTPGDTLGCALLRQTKRITKYRQNGKRVCFPLSRGNGINNAYLPQAMG